MDTNRGAGKMRNMIVLCFSAPEYVLYSITCINMRISYLLCGVLLKSTPIYLEMSRRKFEEKQSWFGETSEQIHFPT